MTFFCCCVSTTFTHILLASGQWLCTLQDHEPEFLIAMKIKIIPKWQDAESPATWNDVRRQKKPIRSKSWLALVGGAVLANIKQQSSVRMKLYISLTEIVQCPWLIGKTTWKEDIALSFHSFSLNLLGPQVTWKWINTSPTIRSSGLDWINVQFWQQGELIWQKWIWMFWYWFYRRHSDNECPLFTRFHCSTPLRWHWSPYCSTKVGSWSPDSTYLCFWYLCHQTTSKALGKGAIKKTEIKTNNC